MTPIGLMDALAARLQTLMESYSSEQPSGTLPVLVYPGYVPVRKDAREKNSHIYVLVFEGTDTKDESTVKVEIGFSIYDADTDNGWRSLFNAMEHVRQDLMKHPFVDMKFRLEFPISCKIAEEQPFPEWQGMLTATYTIGHPDEEGLNYDDYQETKTTYVEYSD